MSTLKVGRLGRDDIVIDCVKTWNLSGDTATIAGTLHANDDEGITVQEALDLRANLVAYKNNGDEPVIPILWSSDPGRNGYYRVLDATVDLGPSALDRGVFPFTLQVQRIRGSASARIESVLAGATITNPHGNNGESWMAFPAQVSEQLFRTDCDSLYARASADGTILFQTCVGHFNGELQYSLDPDDFYVGACKIETGATLALRVGDQVADEPYYWRLSNGLVRITPEAGGRIGLSWWDGGAWTPVKTFKLSGSTPVTSASPFRAGEIVDFTHMRVLRNSPETVIIRLSCLSQFAAPGTIAAEYLPLTWGPLDLDLSLRLGDRAVRGFLSSERSDFWTVAIASAEAATALTGGIRATAADATGNRWVIATSAAKSNDLANGSMTATSSDDEFYFALGAEIDGASAVGSAQAQRIINQAFSGQSEYRLVVAR